VQRAGRGERWADLGCGTGHLAARLAGAGLHVTGVDRDGRMLAAARARFADWSGAGRLRFEVADAASLPFENAALDGVVATSLVGCLDDLAPVFAELARVLRLGGTAVLTFTNRSSVLHAVGRLLAPRGRRSPLLLSARAYTNDEAVSELTRAGLEPLEVRYYNCFLNTERALFPPARLALRLERALAARGRFVARNFVVVAIR
jgi:ubiquinone/menaquinone biosynthesis C-methylase UbiE